METGKLIIDLPTTLEESANFLCLAYDYESNNKIYGDNITLLPIDGVVTYPELYEVVSEERDGEGNLVNVIIKPYTIMTKEKFAKNLAWDRLSILWAEGVKILKDREISRQLEEAKALIESSIDQTIVIPSGGGIE